MDLVLGVPGAGLEPSRRDHGDPELGQPGEVVLVGIPLHDIGMIKERSPALSGGKKSHVFLSLFVGAKEIGKKQVYRH